MPAYGYSREHLVEWDRTGVNPHDRLLVDVYHDGDLTAAFRSVGRAVKAAIQGLLGQQAVVIRYRGVPVAVVERSLSPRIGTHTLAVYPGHRAVPFCYALRGGEWCTI